MNTEEFEKAFQSAPVAREIVGEYFRKVREENGISRNEAARKSGLHYQQVQAIESGSKNYSIDSFLAYIHAIDCYFFLSTKDKTE